MNTVREDKRPSSIHVGAIHTAQVWRRIQAAAFHLPETGENVALSFSKCSQREETS